MVTPGPAAGGGRSGRGPTVRQRLRYQFDNSLTHGPIALIGWLGVVVVGVVLLAATVGYFLLGSAPGDNFLDEFWNNVIRVVGLSETAPAWPSRLFLAVAGLLGVFIGGSLIGLIATALDQRVQKLSTGRSAVLETGHTLILGWSARLPVVVQELVVANQNRARAAVVILAARPVADMEAELRDRVGDPRGTRLVGRSGNPTKPADLELVNITKARSVVVLADDEGDAAVVKAILAIKIVDPDFSHTNVVAEFANPENAATIRSLTDGRVATVNSDEIIAQVTAQACHQSGFSIVFRDLLNFGGNECYFLDVPQLAGHTYREALLAFEGSSVLGLHTHGSVELNPPPETVIGPGDRVIAVAQDDDSATFAGFREVEVPTPAAPGVSDRAPIQILVVGWSNFGPKVVDELEEFLPPGSQIEVCVDSSLVTSLEIHEQRPGLRVSFVTGGPEKLQILAEGMHFDQVIVLGYRAGLTTSEADARTLLTLLTLRRIWPATRVPRVRIIAQLLDQANVELATITGVDDFIVSDALASLMLAQLSERTELQAVFDDLFDPREASLQLRPAHQLLPDAPVAFAQMVSAGAAQRSSVIGWRVNATGEVVMNPPRDRTAHLAADDQVLLVGGLHPPSGRPPGG
ncbi:MAG: hypothetical protein QOI56_905 [Actinomycetota bacterium]|nr:hypothetical protein [Actinomycetota bacterium]